MRAEEQPVIRVEQKDLLRKVEELRDEGCRLVQMHCTKVADDNYEINYSFDIDYQFKTLRLNITPETEIPSITGIYWAAFLYENEIHELFGVGIKGINVDFKGNLYKKKMKNPFAVSPVKGGEGTCPSK
jgi:ech hydrogenase subunit D